MSELKPITVEQRQDLAIAEQMLREARDLVKGAGAQATTKRIRLAITSIGGAIRHANRRPLLTC